MKTKQTQNESKGETMKTTDPRKVTATYKPNGTKIEAGTRVVCNGYYNVVARICAWEPSLCEVGRGANGVCVDVNDEKTLRPITSSDVFDWLGKLIT